MIHFYVRICYSKILLFVSILRAMKQIFIKNLNMVLGIKPFHNSKNLHSIRNFWIINHITYLFLLDSPLYLLTDNYYNYVHHNLLIFKTFYVFKQLQCLNSSYHDQYILHPFQCIFNNFYLVCSINLQYFYIDINNNFIFFLIFLFIKSMFLLIWFIYFFHLHILCLFTY